MLTNRVKLKSVNVELLEKWVFVLIQFSCGGGTTLPLFLLGILAHLVQTSALLKALSSPWKKPRSGGQFEARLSCFSAASLTDFKTLYLSSVSCLWYDCGMTDLKKTFYFSVNMPASSIHLWLHCKFDMFRICK